MILSHLMNRLRQDAQGLQVRSAPEDGDLVLCFDATMMPFLATMASLLAVPAIEPERPAKKPKTPKTKAKAPVKAKRGK